MLHRIGARNRVRLACQLAMFIEATQELASRITGAIRSAADATGASFDYLLRTAQRESNFDPQAKAATSSAGGLFQFIDQTWLSTLKSAGPQLGYGQYANAIVEAPTGQLAVPDPAMRRAIMELRNDPAAASAMAGAFTQQNAATLTERLGRKPTDGELYMAHFLGPSGAGRLIAAKRVNPNADAAAMFPDAARANRSIFHAKNGGARNVAQVYDLLAAKHRDTAVPAIAVAQAQANPSVAPSANNRVATGHAAFIPQGASTIMAATPDEPAAPAYAQETGPVFHRLFRTEAGAPVSDLVSELWSAKSVQFPVEMKRRSQVIAPAAVSPARASPGGRPLDLQQFMKSGLRENRAL
ncbi:MAG: hypothetical protein QOD74_1391 [Variibacter sp.]|jgi:hypothetical protein|nr:hypothetical protein [Variibacter sp.]